LAKLKKFWWLVAILIVLVCGTGVYAAWLIKSGLPGNADFYLKRGKYESLVAKAKSVSLAPGAQPKRVWMARWWTSDVARRVHTQSQSRL